MHVKRREAEPKRRDQGFELNWLLANPHLSLVTKVHGFSSGTIVRCIGRFVFGAARAVLHSNRPSSLDPGSVAFFTSSKNQLQALHPVAQRLKNSCVVEMVDPFTKNADAYFPLHRAYVRSIPDFIALVGSYRKYSAFRKLVIKNRGDLLALAPSLESVAIEFLQANKPQIVVVSDNTVLWARAILSAARTLEIPTVFLQHAPISNIVPPLDADFAFLDGEDAASKYRIAGIDKNCRVYLSGGPRHDHFRQHFNKSQKTSVGLHGFPTVRIGICSNMVDDMHKVTSLLKQVLQYSSADAILLRCHPQDKRKGQFKKLALSLGIEYSSSDKESPEEFMDKIDMVIAGDSSMLLDSVLSNKKVVRSDLLGIYPDYLGLINSGLVARANNRKDIKRSIQSAKKKPSIDIESLQKYCAVIGTPWHGHSSKLVADELINIENNIPPNSKIWKPVNEADQFVLNH